MTVPTAAPTALITGSGVRIGRAIALYLGRRGYSVAVHCNRSRQEAEAVASEIIGLGGKAAVVQADLADHQAVMKLVGEAAAKLGPLSVLVNNASLFEYDHIQTATEESWDRHLDINLKAPFFLSQAFAAQLPDDVPGNIVNLIDMRVWRLTPHFASYTMAKAGLWAMTQALALALAPRIRVNGIGPGPVLPSARQTPEQFARQWQSTPLRRGAYPDEIAAAVGFLLDAPALTGQMIALDGGQHLPWQGNSGPLASGPVDPEE
ncbi:SDR family oxidoreductase [uncultured Ferrovibrio sp.]|jgi:NAD(P)-dependent dehydrogenase (short-subunit alcohol dehydrogenase family)|uniref:SDR family oxidoreductase n=1 Tax=uncultured Ferrovibrio sp. TaxID=1576913 RepID=UPI002601E212|nr:SDR family oxidoreductase [uncultured Ferrovibrio sp.]